MKGKKWKVLYGLFLGVVSCLLYNTLFTLKNANAAIIEMDAPTSGWINCDRNAGNVEWYNGQTTPFTSLCSEWSNTYNVQSNVDFYRLLIPTTNSNNEYKFKQDAYALVTFSMGVVGTKTVMPTGFIGRNINVLQSDVEFIKNIDSIIPLLPNGSIGASQNAINYDVVSSTTYAIYNLKIRIPAGTIWNGKIDLQHGMTMPDTGTNLFQLFISNVRIGWMYEPDSAINQEAQQELNDRNNLESQSGETDNNANNSEQQMQSGTTNLIGAVTSFTNAMRNARTGSCKLPEISAYGMNLGQLDLCTYSPPSWVQGLTSTILSLITVGMAWHVFKRIMGIAKGMAGKG